MTDKPAVDPVPFSVVLTGSSQREPKRRRVKMATLLLNLLDKPPTTIQNGSLYYY